MKLNFLLFFILMGLIGCEKDIDSFTAYTQTAVEWPEVLKLKTSSKHFLAEEDSEIRLGSGEMILFPANSLVDLEGNLVVGKVDLSLTKIGKKADLIFAYLNSNSNSKHPLEHHHIIQIKAYHNTQAVAIASGKKIIVKSPTAHSIAQGGAWQKASQEPNDFKWAPSFNQLKKSDWTVEGQNYSGVEYTTNKLGWVTGASEITTDHKLCVSLPEGYNQAQTKMYFVFADKFTVTEMKPFSDSDKFCTFVPDKTKGNIIIISQDGDSFKYQNESITMTAELRFSAQPINTVLESIVLDLNKL